MPERGWTTECWSGDSWFQDLSRDQRYLFWYFSTNGHCNQAGLYHITLTTISNEAKFTKEELPDLINSLDAKVKWYPEHDLIWVKNFIKRQSKSSKFLAAAAKCLTTIHHNGAVRELLSYNLERYSVSIPYQYYMDRVSIPPGPATATISNKDKGVVKGEKELAIISKLYEENIGMITPVVGEQLKDDSDKYGAGWFGEALKEAVNSGHRNLKYIEAILERWSVEGFKAPRRRDKSAATLPTTKQLKEGWKR